MLYVDCFAGAGKFEDGSKGSPLIALDVLEACIANSRYEMKTAFIEPKYCSELKKNLDAHSLATKTRTVNGGFRENILPVIKEEDTRNIFLYIDPFGIKELSFELFDSVSAYNSSLELLINLNSFGFLREACRVKAANAVHEFDEFLDEEVLEDDFVKEVHKDKYHDRLTDIAGGDYWVDIVNRFASKSINAVKAENEFSARYRERLNKNFKYVIDLPIRDKNNKAPKYRMVHATNHPDGCVLMYDNICKKWKHIRLMQSGGQLSLFEPKYTELNLSKDEISSRFLSHIRTLDDKIGINEVYASFCTKHGILCTYNELKDILKDFDETNKIKLERSPNFGKDGKPLKFMQPSAGKKICLRK